MDLVTDVAIRTAWEVKLGRRAVYADNSDAMRARPALAYAEGNNLADDSPLRPKLRKRRGCESPDEGRNHQSTKCELIRCPEKSDCPYQA